MTNKAFVLGNGTDRPIDTEWLNNLEGDTYGCNAMYRDWQPNFLVANDWSMMLEIINSTYTGNCHFADFEQLPIHAIEKVQYLPEYETAIHIGDQDKASAIIVSGGTSVAGYRLEGGEWKFPTDVSWYVIWLDESFRHITWGFKPQFKHMSTGLCALQLALETGYDKIDVIGFSGLKGRNYQNIYDGTKNYTFDPATPDKDRVPETYVPLEAGHWDGIYRNLVKQYPNTKVNLI